MRTRPHLRRWIAGPALALASTLVCLLAIEGWARLSETLRISRLREQLRASPGVRFHPLLGWEKVPGHVRRSLRGDVDAVFRYNSHGLRGPERGYVRPPGTRRVLVLGDSFAEGFFTGQESTVPAVLERHLAAQGCAPCEVLNGGTAAYSTDQEYLFYREEGRRYGAKVVVLMFYYNDLLANTVATSAGGGSKPRFALDGDALRLTNVPLVAPPKLTEQQRMARVQPQAPWRGSVALRLLGNRTGEANPRLNRLLGRIGLVPEGVPTPPEEMTAFGIGPHVSESWRMTHALLRELKRAVEADAGRLVVLYVPVVFEINDREWELTRERYQLGRRFGPSRVFDKLRAVCEELGVPLADPREALRRSAAAGQAPYCRTDDHWNETGHRIGAEVVAPLVRAALACGGESAWQ
jgi:hypothetical protein